MPTTYLWNEFERKRTEYQDAFCEELRKLSEATVTTEKEKLEKRLKGKVQDDELLRIAKAVLPQIVDVNKDSDQGLIKVGKLRKTLEEATGTYINLNRGYDLRKELLAHLHEDSDRILRQLRRKAVRENIETEE